MTTIKPRPYDEIPHWSGQEPTPRRRSSIWSVLGVILAISLGVFALIQVALLVLFFVVFNSSGSNK
jgi:hypothetical protein